MRRRIALLAVFAVLFQAVLFGWHHHPGHFAVAGHAPVVAFQHGGGPLSPATADDECEVCGALHHLTAAPGEYLAAAPPCFPAVPAASTAAARLHDAPTLSFQARAPPSA